MTTTLTHEQLYEQLTAAGHRVWQWKDDPSNLRAYAAAVEANARADCPGGAEAHEAHMLMNGECPWCAASDGTGGTGEMPADATVDGCTCGWAPRDACDVHHDQEPDDFRGRCGLCGEPYDQTSPLPSLNEVAEMGDPADPDAETVVCHAQCGIDAGLQVA